MTDYIPPDPAVAEFFHRQLEQSQAIHQRLETMTDDELKSVVFDREQAVFDRQKPSPRVGALFLLLKRIARSLKRQPELRKERFADLLGDLLDDPEPGIAKTAIRQCPLTEPSHIQRVRGLLKAEDVRVRAEAAIALAKIQDATILSTLLDWLHGEDEGLHNVAIEALRTLGTEEATTTLVTSYEEQTGDDRDKVVLATALLRMGDSRGVEFLNSLGRRAKGMLSVSAATWLFLAGKVDRGLNLMLHILDRGDIEAKRGMVDQICAWTQSPHRFTADGIHDARLWVQRKLVSPDKTPFPLF